MKIKIKTDEGRRFTFTLPNFLVFSPLSADIIAKKINKIKKENGVPDRVKTESMRKLFRLMRHAKRKGKHFLELKANGEDSCFELIV